MKFEYELTQRDVLSFHDLVNRRTAKTIKAAVSNVTLFVINVVPWLPVGVAVGSYLALYDRYRHPPLASDLNVILIAVVIAGILMAASAFYRRKLVAGAVYRSDGWSESQSVSADPEGLHITSPGASTHCAWTRFSECVEDDAGFYLFLDMSHAVIVPKHVFHSPEELAQFRAWANGPRA